MSDVTLIQNDVFLKTVHLKITGPDRRSSVVGWGGSGGNPRQERKK